MRRAVRTSDYEAIIAILERRYPTVPALVRYRNTFELLMSVILSASTTDAQVNKATPALFARYPDAGAMAACPDARQLEALIHSVGLASAKARYIHETARILTERYDGEVPLDFEALLRLPGVGRKTASVLLCRTETEPAVIVDTHYARVARRLGLSRATSPQAIESDTKRAIRRDAWCSFSQRINLLGREWCVARAPRCQSCPLRAHCLFFAQTGGGAEAGAATAKE